MLVHCIKNHISNNKRDLNFFYQFDIDRETEITND